MILDFYKFYSTCILCNLFNQYFCEFSPSKIIYAVNCGDDAKLKDSFGIEYLPDNLKVGTTHLSTKPINRVNSNDARLYQSERYHNKDFTYDIPLYKDGQYFLVLKFSEVYFKSTGQKVFDVELMGEPIVSDLDIFARSGFCIAHDEYIPFIIKHNKLIVNGVQIDIDKSITLTFKKSHADNPKINAFYIYQGDFEDIPKLEAFSTSDDNSNTQETEEQLNVEDEDLEDELDVSHITQKKYENVQMENEEREKLRQIDILKRSGYLKTGESGEELAADSLKLVDQPKEQIRNPYDEDNSSLVLPVVFCIAAFIPILLLACKV